MRHLFAVALFAFFLPCLWGQASVNETLETAFYWVDAVKGSDLNPGTQALPFKSIGVGVSAAEANNRLGIGSRITVNPGVYREAVTLAANYQDTALPITIEAATAGSVVVSGADMFTGWSSYSGNKNIYTTAWPYQYGLCGADPNGGPFQQDIVLRRELVFVDGAPLTQVLTLSQMRESTFFADETNATLYIWPPSGTKISSADVEIGARDNLFTVANKSAVVVRGITFQYSNACRTKSALTVINSDNVLLDSDFFYWNNSQGPGMIQDSQFTVQNSISNHNGAAGTWEDRSLNGLWSNITTNYNNWRGAQGAYYLWTSAGFHPYATHYGAISGLTSAFNQCYGIHWDTDNRDDTADNLILSENLLAEGFVEKSEGPISITNSYFCGGNPTTGPSSIGFQIRNSPMVSLTGSTIANDTPELNVVGTAGGYPVTDWQTGQVYNLVTDNLSLSGNTIVANAANQNTFHDPVLGGADWTSFQATFSSDYNTWWNPLSSKSFIVPSPANNTALDFTGWQSATGQDQHSSFAQPAGDYLGACTLTPESQDFWYVTNQNKIVTSVPAGGSVSFTTSAVAFGGFSGTINLTADVIKGIPQATSSWDTQSINASGDATLSVSTSSSTPTGVYPVTMIANSGVLTRTITGSVLVNTVLAVDPKVANLGPVNVGSASTAFWVTLADVGSNGVPISSITTTGDFSQTNTCGTEVGGSNQFNSQCAISIVFAPKAVGTRTGTLTILASDPGSPITVSLTGVGVGIPVATSTPPALTFPTTDVGSSSQPMSVTVSNTGTASLAITSISVSGISPNDFTQTNTCPGTLAVGASCSIAVTFVPKAAAKRDATISISDNASTSVQTIALVGTGAYPKVTLNPGSVNFGQQTLHTTSATQTVTVQNVGTGPLYISSIAITGADPGDFADANGCPIAPAGLAANATCTIAASFTPTLTGLRSAAITLTENAQKVTQSVLLFGYGR